MMDFDYSDLFVAAVAGAVVFRTAEWAFVRWMERWRRLPLFRDVYDHCRDCELPVPERKGWDQPLDWITPDGQLMTSEMNELRRQTLQKYGINQETT